MGDVERSVDSGSWKILAFPGLGRLGEDGVWRVELEGIVYQRREIGLRKRMLLRVLRRYISASPQDFESALFQERVEAFVGATRRGKQPEFAMEGESFEPTRRTRSNGRFSATVKLGSAGERSGFPAGARATQPGQWLAGPQFQMRLAGASATASVPTFLVPPRGLSVVSDIDDTIKHTQVSHRREMLINTFLRPFEAVQGMAEAYRELSGPEVMFHYVSSSPWQLLAPLRELLERAGFPAGSIHLRNFLLRDHMLRRVFLLHRRGKGGVIRHLLETFPKRRFLLIGDSGERDPMIYAKLALKHPQQVEAILIRTLEPGHREKLVERFRGSRVLRQRVIPFADADELRRIFAARAAGSFASS